MEIIDEINAAKSIQQLDNLRDDIHHAASRNEIDFKTVKRIFLKRKAELEGKK